MEHLGHHRNVGQQNQGQNNQAAEEEAEAGNHRSAEFGHLSLAHHAVQGEQQGRQQGQCHPRHVQLSIPWADNDHCSQNFQGQSGYMPGLNWFFQQKKGQKGDEYRITAEHHCRHRGVGVADCHLENRHTQGYADQPQQSKVGHGLSVQLFFPLFQIVEGHWQQKYKTDGKPA